MGMFLGCHGGAVLYEEIFKIISAMNNNFILIMNIFFIIHILIAHSCSSRSKMPTPVSFS